MEIGAINQGSNFENVIKFISICFVCSAVVVSRQETVGISSDIVYILSD